ncbi:hypothetical protein [Alkaliphilus serpentinus]|uniref:Uncharacterized protein n=1 Tax=Alkaliphilus serpentinus TaxID=1482731 RepID=A0A833M6U8_9FIRM|nr:hypothetical protein [Alkaliphilus serpentinus]KAB3529073.1 hypothetical protein F8153_10500 [Alkaliphilus serpentinus]
MLISFTINKDTLYHKSENPFSKAIVVVVMVIAIFTFIIIPSQRVSKNYSSNISIKEESVVIDDYIKTEIDISHLQADERIEVHALDEDKLRNSSLSIFGVDFENSPEGKIIIETRLPINNYNGYDLNEYINPKVLGRLEGNKLYIDYSYKENVKVIFTSSWINMWQFDRYQDRGLTKDKAGSAMAKGSGHIKISAPEGITLDFKTK